MCLAVSGRIVEKQGLNGTVEMNGMRVKTSFHLVPEARPGDYVLLHAGFAIQMVEEQEALETNALLDQIVAGEEE